MVLGLVQYVLGGKFLGEAGVHPEQPATAADLRRLKWGAGTVALVLVVGLGLQLTGTLHVTAEGLADSFGVMLLALTVVFFIWLLTRGYWDPVERKRLVAIMVLFLAVLLGGL